MTVKLLTEHHLGFLSLKGGCTGSSESTPVKIPHYWKSRVTAQLLSSDVFFIDSHYFKNKGVFSFDSVIVICSISL